VSAWFEWNGEKSTLAEYGLYVSAHPDICIPEERLKDVTVPGRSGTLTQFEGEGVYNGFIASVECFILSPDTLPAIAAWLKGSGEVVFGNQPGVFYKARVTNQIAFAQVMRGRSPLTCVVNFRCEPYRYLPDGKTPQTFSANNSVIHNPGTAPSEPSIRVNVAGGCTLMIRGQIVHLMNITSFIVLDAELKEAYTSKLANEKMVGEFPLLYPGANVISWEGGVTGVQITPRWRNL
jgi:phage-related protein